MERHYRFTVHKTQLGRKPSTGKEKKEIHQNMEVMKLTIKKLCKIVESPHSWTITPKVFIDNIPGNKSLLAVTGFMLDFDLNSDPEEIIQRFKDYGLIPNFYYTTHSDTPEYRKFRIGIMLDQEVDNIEKAKYISDLLLLKFPCDISCIDNARIFWGGKKSYFLSDEPNKMEKILLELSSNKRFKKDLKFDKKTVSLLKYNNDTGNLPLPPYQFLKGDVDDFAYLESLRKNDFNFELLKKKVRVFREFVDGEIRLEYPLLFNLALSMRWVQGGLKLMKKSMNLYNKKVKNINKEPVYSTKHFVIFDEIKDSKYRPVDLDYISPYTEDHGLGNPITVVRNQAHKIEVIEKTKKINLEQGEKMLSDAYQNSISSKDYNIHIIKANVGLGKTKILSSQEHVAICVSTHQLIAELAQEMKVDVHLVPEIPKFLDSKINQEISLLYNSGLGLEARNLIKNLAENFGSNDSNLALEYLKNIEKAKTTSKTLITTHQRSFYHSTSHDTIIYDEDCIGSLVSINHLYLEDLNRVIFEESVINEDLLKIYLDLKKAQKKVLIKKDFNFKITEDLLEILVKRKGVSNILDFFQSDYYFIEEISNNTSTGTKVTYGKFRDFPKDKKIIILSSTIDIDLYIRRFGSRIKIYEIPDVVGVGEIIQYTRFSNSKQSLNFRSKTPLLEKIRDEFVITFKNESDFFNAEHHKKNPIKNVYFGNCRGYNLLSGMNIHVVGTYHHNQAYYFFLAKFSGIELDFEEDTKIKNQVVTWKGIRFTFFAYDHPVLRQIQFNCIEGELIQAIGRARTIRRMCTVTCYSNFPLTISDQFITKDLNNHEN